MFEKNKKKLSASIKEFWDLWEKKSIWVSALIAVIPLLIYYFGYLNFIRENTGSFITYASTLVTINGVFLTLIVTLKQSQIFERLRRFFPHLHNYLYEGLKGQIVSCIIFIGINLAISIVGPISNEVVAYVGLYMWSCFFIYTFIGAFYTLKIVTNLASVEPDKRNVRK